LEKKRLLVELDTSIQQYNTRKETLECSVKTLEEGIDFFNLEIQCSEKEIESLNPGFTSLCEIYAEMVKNYEDTRKNLIGNLNKIFEMTCAPPGRNKKSIFFIFYIKLIEKSC
jgi:hypothetical protein